MSEGLDMVLSFDDENGKRHFEFCFVGFILGGSIQNQKGLTILRREMKIFEKLESISDLKPCGKKMPNGEAERQLKNGEDKKEIPLEPPEFDMLFNYIAEVPWQSGTPTRYALETLDWLLNHGRQ